MFLINSFAYIKIIFIIDLDIKKINYTANIHRLFCNCNRSIKKNRKNVVKHIICNCFMIIFKYSELLLSKIEIMLYGIVKLFNIIIYIII